MAKLPDDIMELMQSDAYSDSSDPDHASVSAQVAKYFQDKYGKSTTDATGRNVAVRKVWIWHAILDDRTCGACESFSEEIYENESDIPKQPHHKHCRCWIEEVYMDDANNKIPVNKFDDFNDKSRDAEGGYEDDPKKIDQPTNSGITGPTLKQYNSLHPNFNFPDNVKDLTSEQIYQIYKELFFENRRIDEIENERIGYAIYDMGIMSNFKNVVKMVQEAIKEVTDDKVSVDGVIGDETLKALNNIPDDKVDDFMNALKENRLEYLRGLDTWDEYGRGWVKRTNKY